MEAPTLHTAEADALVAVAPGPMPPDEVPTVQPHAPAPAAATSRLSDNELRRLMAELEELRNSKADLERMRNVDAQLTRFTDLMRWQVEYTLQGWSERLLDALAPYLDAINAAFYLMESEPAPLLRLIGGYAMPAGTLPTIRPGEGLTGQVARTGRLLVLDDPRTFRAATDTSLARIEAAAFVIYPLVHDNKVEGVLEVSLLAPPSAEHLEFLRQLTAGIAANLGSIRAQVQIQNLLAEAQSKTEALAAQEEEMRQNLEELEATQEEMRRVQQALEERQAEFQRMTNTVPGMIYQFRMDPSGSFSFTYISEGSWDVLGMAPEAILGDAQEVVQLIEPEDLPSFQQALEISATSLHPFKWIGRMTIPDGTKLWINAQSVPRKEDDGSFLWDGIMMDVTREKESELRLMNQQAQLAAQEEEMRQNLEELEATQEEMRRAQGAISQQQTYLSAIIDSSDASVSLYDREYRFLVFNRVIRDRYVELGKELRIGDVAFNTFDESIHAEWKGYYDRALGGEAFKLVKTRQDPDRLRFVEYDFRPVKEADGSIPYFALFSRDVTRYKELEQNIGGADTRLSKFAENGPVILYQHWLRADTREQRFTYVSSNVEPILGYAVAEFLSLDQAGFIGRMNPLDVKKFSAAYKTAAGSSNTFDVTVRFKHGQTNDYVKIRLMSHLRRGGMDNEVESDGIIQVLG